jgi:hypothetical protein
MKSLKKLKSLSLEQLMKQLAKRKRKFHPSVWVQPKHGLIEICLEDVACYHEWIRGEGADISIWRAMKDKRVVGVTLPLRKWEGFLGQIID